MRIPASAHLPGSDRSRLPSSGGPWYTMPGTWVAIAALAFLVVAVLPMTLAPKPQWAALQEPRLPCETVDWRVGEKLAVLAERDEPRVRAIVNRMTQERATARQLCRSGLIDDALIVYRLLDRALTRYVQAGTAPNLPK